MRVLLALPDAPDPPVTGGHWRDWQLVNLLTRAGHELHVLMFATADTSAKAIAADRLRAMAATLVFGGHRLEQADRGLHRTMCRKLSYLVAGTPATHPQAFQYDAIGASERMAMRAREVDAEAVVMRSFWCGATPRLKAQGHLVIADNPDYNSALMREMVAVSPGFRKIGPWANSRGVRRLERRLLPTCDELWIATRDEAEAMQRDMRLDRVLVLPNLFDVDSVPDYAECAGEPGTMLLVANFGYLPNARAAERLLDEVLPAVRRDVPEARVTFVGGGMSETLRGRVQRAGCDATGRVDAVDRYYASHAIVVVPVIEGAGMLFKTVEALAYGRCTAGLTPAFRGLPATGSPPFVSVDTPRELASSLARLLRDPDRRRVLARSARAFAERHLSWRVGDDRLRGSVLAGG